MTAAGTDRRHLHVLVVEDELLIRWSIAETLAHCGHRVTQAENGAAALRELRASDDVDAVVLDYRLPDSNDFTLLRTIVDSRPGRPVIMISAYGNPEITQGALAVGAHAVMNKPFDLQDLEQRLRDACASKRS